jgi:DNA polymerase I-like protein with 3'-5' exonuclease and polymerase domains
MLIRVGNLSSEFRPWRRQDGRALMSPFAFDIETTQVVGHGVPDYVLGAACDGKQGVFVLPGQVHDFLQAHIDNEVVFHHCAFDLAVLSDLLKAQGKTLDVYNLVDRQKVWDTQLLHRLYALATVGHTFQGKGQSTLEACAARYLGVALPKQVTDAAGNDVRTSWGRWKGRPANKIPDLYLDYLAKDVLCTHACYEHLLPAVRGVLDGASRVWGHAGADWLKGMILKYGPLTHHLQVMAAVALGEVERVGFGLDIENRNEIVAKVRSRLDELTEELGQGGYVQGRKGCEKALQDLIRQTVQQHPDVGIPLTPTGKYSTREEDLDALADVSGFFAVYKEFKQVRTLLNNFLIKMDAGRIHPHYDILKNTGRTGSKSPNIQGFPRKKKGKHSFDVRRCFLPPPGKVFYVADYASIELRTLSQALLTQFKLDSHMARAINAGQDLHRLVAARMKATALPDAGAVLADPARFAEVAASVTADERNSAKPANFGLPAGMGARRLKDYAKAQYGQPYTEEDARGWTEAWLASFPEMGHYREDGFDAGLALAEELGLTPGDYRVATGGRRYGAPVEDEPVGWLGGMALKALGESVPTTNNGRQYSLAELDYFWGQLQQLGPRLEPRLGEALRARQANPRLRAAVQKLLERAGVFTITGRLRARASYTARRNTCFQGAASDGAKLSLYRLWRAGFTVVAFIHDEVVVEVDEAADLAAARREIDGILVGAMKEICPDILIEVEGSFRRRWGKEKDDVIPIPPGTLTPVAAVPVGSNS